MQKLFRIKNLIHLLILFSLILGTAGCGGEAEEPEEVSAPVVAEATEEVQATEGAPVTEATEASEQPATQPPVVEDGNLYKHPTGAFQFIPMGQLSDEGSDYALFEGEQDLLLAVISSTGDELDESTAYQLSEQSLDSFIVGTDIVAGFQLTDNQPEAINSGFLARFEAATQDGGTTTGAVFLRKEGGAMYVVILLTPDYTATEATFREVVQSFAAGANSSDVAQAEADSGFRPEEHGFSFPNYGGEPGITNLTPVEMRELFGDQVCGSLAGGTCTLTPPAKSWMDQVNGAMVGGHCEGMAVLSQLMYYGFVDPNQFGGATAHQLSIQNEALQREIAYWFATQITQPGNQTKINESPVQVVEALMEAFKDGANAQDSYAVGIFKRDGSGGHAVTPIAVDDKGDGMYDILVYDNNMPNQVRSIRVDANANTWQYEASINPNEPQDTYEGDVNTQSLEIVSLSPRLQTQVCDFCTGGGSQSSRGGRGLAQAAPEYYQVWLDGPANLMITDDQDRRIGYVDGELINEIPNAVIDRVKLGVNVWDADYEPIYQIPTSGTFAVTIDASMLTEPSLASVTLIGPGFFMAVEEIALEPGEVDGIGFTRDGNQFFVVYSSDYTETPEIFLGIETDAADYAFLVQASKLTGAEDTLNVGLDLEAGTFFLSTLTNLEPGTFNFYVLRIDDEGESAFGAEDYEMAPDNTIFLEYLAWPGNESPMQAWIDSNDDGVPDEVLELPDTTDEFIWE